MPGTKKRPNLFLVKEAKEEEPQSKKRPKTLSLVSDELDSTDAESGDEYPQFKKSLLIAEENQDSQPAFDSTPLTPPPEHQPQQNLQEGEPDPEEGDVVLPPPNPIDLLKLSAEAPIEKRGDLTVLKLGEKTTIHVVKG